MASNKYTYNMVVTMFRDHLQERSDYESEWKHVSNNLLPGRGIFQHYSKPRKRDITSNNIINTVAEDALGVLTAGLHGRLTSPSAPWFRTRWSDDKINYVEPLKIYLADSTRILQDALLASNFYSVINSFYTEYAGFGNGCIFIDENTDNDLIPFRFNLLTVGEYSFSLGKDGLPSVFIRTIFMSERQLVDHFPDTVSTEVKERVRTRKAGIDKVNLSIIECIVKEDYQDKKYYRVMYEHNSATTKQHQRDTADKKPLQEDGFYEWPYPVARWNVIGSDTYGVGVGARAVKDIQRLQEMEKALLVATHKAIDPPLNAPSRMRGKLSTLPGGRNYYVNPNEKVESIYNVPLDYNGVVTVIDRIEKRLQRTFFNDVFITGSRDPNASPLKATQVIAQEREAAFRLGPMVNRTETDLLVPAMRRCFNILKRKGMLPAIDPALEEIAGEFMFDLVSPMAIAQKAAQGQGVDSFMGFTANAAQFDPTVLDNVDGDKAVRDRAEIEGVGIGTLRSEEAVKALREQRAKQQAAQAQAEQNAAQQQGVQAQQTADVGNRKTAAEAGQILGETQQVMQETGL